MRIVHVKASKEYGIHIGDGIFAGMNSVKICHIDTAAFERRLPDSMEFKF